MIAIFDRITRIIVRMPLISKKKSRNRWKTTIKFVKNVKVIMKNSYKIAIIDDDELAADNLIFELKTYPRFDIEGIAKSGAAGKKLIFKTMPDLVFLDVELPDMQGPELLNLIRNEITWNMQVIFYTAYDKYMLDAIRESVFDYLLKPIEKNEFSKMMKRFIEKVERQQMQRVPFHILLRSLSPLEQTFIIPSPTNDLQFLRPENVGFFQYNSGKKQWEAYLNNATVPIAIRRNIVADQILASSPSFLQIHQSYIINIIYLIMIKDKKCVFFPPFDNVRNLQISKLYLKKLQEKFLML